MYKTTSTATDKTVVHRQDGGYLQQIDHVGDEVKVCRRGGTACDQERIREQSIDCHDGKGYDGYDRGKSKIRNHGSKDTMAGE